MNADIDVVVVGKCNCFPHDVWVTAVVPTGDVCRRDVRHHFVVSSFGVLSEALSHITVDVDLMSHSEQFGRTLRDGLNPGDGRDGCENEAPASVSRREIHPALTSEQQWVTDGNGSE
jgi:hypothetical protein